MRKEFEFIKNEEKNGLNFIGNKTDQRLSELLIAILDQATRAKQVATTVSVVYNDGEISIPENTGYPQYVNDALRFLSVALNGFHKALELFSEEQSTKG